MKITLANLHEATAQQVFDQVATHLLTQKVKSTTGTGAGSCQYRGENNTMCAAGCLIADEEYKPEMEGNGWSGCIDQWLVPDSTHTVLITQLQSLHDKKSPDRWGWHLRMLAVAFSLNAEVLSLPY